MVATVIIKFFPFRFDFSNNFLGTVSEIKLNIWKVTLGKTLEPFVVASLNLDGRRQTSSEGTLI